MDFISYIELFGNWYILTICKEGGTKHIARINLLITNEIYQEIVSKLCQKLR